MPVAERDLLFLALPLLASLGTQQEVVGEFFVRFVQFNDVVDCVLIPVEGTARHVLRRFRVTEDHMRPMADSRPLVVVNHELEFVGAVTGFGQSWAQIKFNEVSLQFRTESEAIPQVFVVEAGVGLILDSHAPHTDIAFGVCVQKPATSDIDILMIMVLDQ